MSAIQQHHGSLVGISLLPEIRHNVWQDCIAKALVGNSHIHEKLLQARFILEVMLELLDSLWVVSMMTNLWTDACNLSIVNTTESNREVQIGL